MQPDERLEQTGRPEEAPAWVLVALAVALVMLVPGLALNRSSAHAGPGPDGTRVVDPFVVDACPVHSTPARGAGSGVFPTTAIRSIRLCPAGSQRSSEPLDALVIGTAALVQSLDGAASDPGPCRAGSSSADATSVQVTTSYGRVATLTGSPCATVSFQGRDLTLAAIAAAVRRSIDAQRLVSPPARYSPGVSCLRPATLMAIRPAVEHLVNAVSCRRRLPYVLPRTQLAALRHAWSAAPTGAGSRLPVPCREGSRRPPPPLVLLTDFGDTVRPVWDACRDRWTVSAADRLLVLPPVGAPPLSEW